MAGDDKKTQSGADPFNPFQPMDLGRMLEQMQVPGIDVSQLAEDARKNIEALQAANQAVAAGWQALAEKQMEIFQQTMQGWLETMKPPGGEPASAEKQTELAREGFEKALENMRELAEIASVSQTKAFDIMRTRFEENMRSMFPSSKKTD
ncbi:MAG: phasin family protein [Pseudomonadales bacterium]